MTLMNIEGTRRVMETTSHETANQYLRFGWNLINQYVVPATADSPATVTYVLASVRRLEDTRQVLVLNDPDAVNDYLDLGWKLIDKHVTTADGAQNAATRRCISSGLAERRAAAAARLQPHQ